MHPRYEDAPEGPETIWPNHLKGGGVLDPPPLCDIPSGCCFFTVPWTVTRSSLRVLRWVAAFCQPLRPVLLLVSFPRSRSPVVGVLGLCWMWRDVPFVYWGCAGCCGGRLTVFAVPTPPSSGRPPPPPRDAELLTKTLRGGTGVDLAIPRQHP